MISFFSQLFRGFGSGGLIPGSPSGPAGEKHTDQKKKDRNDCPEVSSFLSTGDHGIPVSQSSVNWSGYFESSGSFGFVFGPAGDLQEGGRRIHVYTLRTIRRVRKAAVFLLNLYFLIR